MEKQPGSHGFKPGKLIGSLVMIGGLVLGAKLWQSGKPISDSLTTVLLYAIFGFWIIMIEEGISTGKLIGRGGYTYRDKHPKSFWFLVVLYIVVIAFFLTGLAMLNLEDLGLM